MKAYPFSHKHPTLGTTTQSEGMELRDYFAAQCIPLVARYSPSMGWTDKDRIYYAKVCYVMADAMMKARENKDE